MSATTLSAAGLKAVEQRNWQDAITNLTKAIDQSKSPAWLVARSQAYLETGQPAKALRDAEYAYCVAAERGNDKSRLHMIEATYRRSVASFRTKKYADADKLALWSQLLAEGVSVKTAADVDKEKLDGHGFYHATVQDALDRDKNNDEKSSAGATSRLAKLMGGDEKDTMPYKKQWNKTQMFRVTVLQYLEALPADDPARKPSVKVVPTKPSLEDPKDESTTQVKDPEIEASKASFVQSAPQPKADTAGQPFRSQFYQSDSSITATLFMKFASKDDAGKVQVDIQPNLITVNGVPREPSTLYLVPHAAIDPAKSTYRAIQMKMEFTLAKAVPGKWPSFGREELSPPDPSSLPSAETHPASVPTVATSASGTGPSVSSPTAASTSSAAAKEPRGPAYPTSSKSGPKDWEKIGEDGEDEEDPKDVNQFFQNIFKNSTPEQQRAMMKSYTESNGTSLSTDWDSVSKGKVETEPPKGVEAKEWAK